MKRFGVRALAIDRLKASRRRYLHGETPRDLVNLALCDNLMALGVLPDSRERAESALAKAGEQILEAVQSDDLETSERSAASRYACQVAINRAQLAVSAHDLSTAERLLRDNLAYCDAYAMDYVPEAAGEFAYVAFLTKHYDSALRLAQRAVQGFSQVGALGGLKTCREIAVGALVESGRSQEAESLAALIDGDPLGLHGLGAVQQ